MDAANNRAVLQLGRILATPDVLAQIPRFELFAAVERHRHCDWGELCKCDKQANNTAFQNSDRILSAYRSAEGVKFWVITEADRSHTTVLLPDEY